MARGYPDFEGDKVGLYLKPEWATFEGKDKDFTATVLDIATGLNGGVGYTVPAGKTLYVIQFGFALSANLAADRDNNQMCLGEVYNVTTAIIEWKQGGNGGGAITFPKPIVITAGQEVVFRVTNFANHNCDLRLSASGYEV